MKCIAHRCTRARKTGRSNVLNFSILVYFLSTLAIVTLADSAAARSAEEEDEFEFHAPSSVNLVLGGDRQKSKNANLDVTLTMNSGWQLGFGGEYSRIPDSNTSDDLIVSGGHFSLHTDPYQNLAGHIEAEYWKMGSEVSSRGVQGSADWITDYFLLKFIVGGSTIELSDLPRLIFSDRKSTVTQSKFGSSLLVFLGPKWAMKGFYSSYHYSQDLGEYGTGLRTRVMPASVLTSVGGFPSHEGGAELSWAARPWTLSFEVSRSTSALDDVRSTRVQLAGDYQFSEHWSGGLALGTVKPENSAEDPADNRFANLAFTYQWR